ncbi:MAG TPA: BamA/TamA family outer membrane protein [Gemmatimonadaceae bacterium]|jgi:hypothetical protein
MPNGGARAVLVAALLAAAGGAARAQGADTTVRADTLSYDDATAVAYLYNLPASLRAASALTITRDQTVSGNVAVLGAPLVIGGHVTGRVVVINGDVTVLPGARVDSDLVVTGGKVRGVDSTSVGGHLRVYAPRLPYRLEGDQVVAVHDESQGIANWFRQWKRRHLRTRNRVVLKSGTYNRVEGLPVILGPTVRQNTPLGPLSVDALGIYRSADHFAWKSDNLGYNVTGEMQFGYRHAVALGVEAFDVVAPVESWQLRDSEIGLASFFLHRDFRDYYNSKGARAYVAVRDGSALSATLGLGQERWQPRAARDPWTLFRGNDVWRPNPVMDAGTFTLATATVTYDTRNDRDNPWTGWFATASLEHGWSQHATLGPTSDVVRAAASTPVPVAYTRGVLDLRRYNRLSPESQLNLRLFAGGWLGGDPLPLERRFSLGGPGSLPGYDFREAPGGTQDALSCSAGQALPGAPAQCDRMVLVQAEYRRDLRLHLFGDWGAQSSGGGWSWTFYHPLQWVVFTDAGRGWLLHERGADGIVQPADAFPPLGTYRADAGVGLDADVLGVFVAKSLTDWKHPVQVVVRLRHRF